LLRSQNVAANRIKPARRLLQGLGRDVRVTLDHRARLLSIESPKLVTLGFETPAEMFSQSVALTG
jgi:hypothetical protein